MKKHFYLFASSACSAVKNLTAEIAEIAEVFFFQAKVHNPQFLLKFSSPRSPRAQRWKSLTAEIAKTAEGQFFFTALPLTDS